MIRSLRVYNNQSQEIRSMARKSLEADAETVLRAITPVLESTKYKGQAGELQFAIFVQQLYTYFDDFI